MNDLTKDQRHNGLSHVIRFKMNKNTHFTFHKGGNDEVSDLLKFTAVPILEDAEMGQVLSKLS
jgi:hypothetical protein